jgi:predicted acyl esterase
VLHLSSSVTSSTVSVNLPEPEGLQTDPIANSGCRVIPSATDPDVASWSFPVAGATTLLGSRVVHVSVTVDGVDAVLAARLWDVDPVAGSQALVARTVYRISVPSPGTTSPVAFELFANVWQVAAGHQLKLELTQDDAPYWRADNLASALGYAGLRLDIPVR